MIPVVPPMQAVAASPVKVHAAPAGDASARSTPAAGSTAREKKRVKEKKTKRDRAEKPQTEKESQLESTSAAPLHSESAKARRCQTSPLSTALCLSITCRPCLNATANRRNELPGDVLAEEREETEEGQRREVIMTCIQKRDKLILFCTTPQLPVASCQSCGASLHLCTCKAGQLDCTRRLVRRSQVAPASLTCVSMRLGV